ncbi:hypothetical protein B7463_g9168, partial [Scytalidium lignicola]
MAFLFKNKKNAEKQLQGVKEVPANVTPSQGSQSSSTNGRTSTEKGLIQQTSPGSSVNNSLNSLHGSGSPDAINGRRGPSSEQSDLPLRNGASPNASLYPWSQRRLTYTTSHPPPFPRYGVAVNATASKEGDIYLMGGLVNSSTVKGDLWMVEAGGNMACYPLATTAEGPGPRVGHASLLVGNAFIVYGGDTKMEDADVLDETLYLLNTSTRQWSRAVPGGPRPAGRYGHSLNILGSKIYVFGGQVEGYFMNDLVAFDLNQLQVPSNRWEILLRSTEEGGPPIGQIPPPRTNHTIVTYNEKLYLFGGTNGYHWFNDVWCYDPVPNAWTLLDCIGYIPAPREGHAAAIVDDVMYIFGGRTEEGADLGDLASFRISTRRWYTFQNMGPSPSPRSGHSMTAYGKQIVVLAGEPSSASREVADLGIVYILDTGKIRYPNDQQIQQTAAGERVPGPRRPSGGDKAGMMTGRGMNPRDSPSGPIDGRRMNGPGRDSIMGPGPGSARGNGPPGLNGNDGNSPLGPGQQGPPGGSRLPRASMAQGPPGPPPQQQAPHPRSNVSPSGSGTGSGRAKSPGRQDRDFGPDTNVFQNRAMSPIRDSPRDSPGINGQLSQPPQGSKPMTREDSGDGDFSRNGSRSKQSGPGRTGSKGSTDHPPRRTKGGSLDSIGEVPMRPAPTREAVERERAPEVSAKPPPRQTSPPPPTRQGSNPLARKSSARNSQTVSLLKELDSVKNRNAWYASELELARKAGYVPNPSNNPMLDQRTAESFDEEDKPLIEALLAMKQDLTNVQSSIDKQAIIAAKKIAEVEKQRDAAVSEAVYFKAKFAAHTGSQRSTPQPGDSESRDLSAIDADRSSDMSKKLAAALTLQRDLANRVEQLTGEINSEKRARELAEETANSAQGRITELENYKQQNASEVERLKAELHEIKTTSREESVACAEAVAALKLVQVEKESFEKRYKEAAGASKEHSETFASLREAIAASADMKNLLERKLDEERTLREKIEGKLNMLKTEHEARTTELETATRRLRDAEEISEQNANEARLHQQAVLAGLDKASTRDIEVTDNSNDERVKALESQVETANALVRKYQVEADMTSEKLRSAEERIAGLEAYQEQASREGMSVRKQLQIAMREVQSLQAANSDMRNQLANQQLETNAVNVQHNTLKDILGERGISPANAARRGLSSPQSGANTPDQARLRDIEQQLTAATESNEQIRQIYEAQKLESETAYKEKLTQLENDYQSAVHYVKGTEKMLKRMKDELSKYKADNDRMRDQIIGLEDNATAIQTNTAWEEDRANLQQKVEELQAKIASSSQDIERRMAEVQNELQAAQKERDQIKQASEVTQQQLKESIEQSKADIESLQQEKIYLEMRAQDAERKVSLLLDQVENSVDNYRRQSRLIDTNGTTLNHQRDLSGNGSISEEESNYASPLDNRNSMALDSLATELETLRAHWETTNKNYRLSNVFDFDEQSPTTHRDVSPKGTDLSGSIADWRKRLDAEEAEAKSRNGSSGGSPNSGGVSGRREISPSK